MPSAPQPVALARIAALATYAPAHRLTNSDLQRMVDTSDEWIVKRTGIHERRIAGPDEYTSDLALAAVRRLIEQTGPLAEVDLVIAATSTADYVFPSLAAQVQDAAGLTAGAFDVAAACGGFVYALNLATTLVAAKQARAILVIGAEAMSKSIDYTDRATCILFGDGAGAALVVPGDDRSYVEATSYGSDGASGKHLYRTAARHEMNGTVDDTGYLRQAGSEVYKWAVRRIPAAIDALLAQAGMHAGDVDWFVPHSANLRIIEALCKSTGIPTARTLSSIAMYGNTSSASIPLAIAPALADGRIKRGDRVLLVGFGGGLVYAGSLLRW
jgi:3-oxoacyl-[acyl-carrier-protein] synthase-3